MEKLVGYARSKYRLHLNDPRLTMPQVRRCLRQGGGGGAAVVVVAAAGLVFWVGE